MLITCALSPALAFTGYDNCGLLAAVKCKNMSIVS